MYGKDRKKDPGVFVEKVRRAFSDFSSKHANQTFPILFGDSEFRALKNTLRQMDLHQCNAQEASKLASQIHYYGYFVVEEQGEKLLQILDDFVAMREEVMMQILATRFSKHKGESGEKEDL